jgi:hypothetical protein
MNARQFLAAGVLACVSLAGCSKADDVHIALANVGNTEADELTEVRVFVGAHKKWLPEIAPGASLEVVMSPEGTLPLVTVAFTQHGEEQTWTGPDLERGAGYRMVVRIAPGGHVDEKHCRMPCNLP